MPEISAEELNLLRGSASLLDEVWNDPKHGLALKRAVKDKRPNVSIPEIDVPDVVLRPINDQMSALQAAMAKQSEELAALRQADADAKLAGKFRASLDGAKARFGLTDEGVEATLNIMRERQIADPEAAAALHIASLPKAKPASHRDAAAYGGSSFANLYGMQDGSGDTLLHTNPDAFFDREVAAVMNEFAA